jgi:hypothetical protein
MTGAVPRESGCVIVFSYEPLALDCGRADVCPFGGISVASGLDQP